MRRNDREALMSQVLPTGEVVPANDVVWSQRSVGDMFCGRCISTMWEKSDAEARQPPPICDALFACMFSESVRSKKDPTKKITHLFKSSCGAAGPGCFIGAAHSSEAIADTWPPTFNKFNVNACRITRFREVDFRKQAPFFHATNRALPLLCIDHHGYTKADGGLMMPGDAACYAASDLTSANNFIIPSLECPRPGDACQLFGVGDVGSGSGVKRAKIEAFCLRAQISVEENAVRIQELHNHHNAIFGQVARFMTEGVFCDPATPIESVDTAYDHRKTFLDFENAVYDCPSSDNMRGGFVSEGKCIRVGDANYFVVQAIHGSSASPLNSNNGLMTCSISFAILYCGFPLMSNMQMFDGLDFENMSGFNPYGEYVSAYFIRFRDEMLARRDQITHWYLSEDAAIFPKPGVPPLPAKRREIFEKLPQHLDGFFGWLASLEADDFSKGRVVATREKYS